MVDIIFMARLTALCQHMHMKFPVFMSIKGEGKKKKKKKKVQSTGKSSIVLLRFEERLYSCETSTQNIFHVVLKHANMICCMQNN